jgi:hypothetical protein
MLTLPNANFEKGQYYTIVVTGHAKGTPKLEALMVADKLSGSGAMASAEQKKAAENEKMLKSKY